MSHTVDSVTLISRTHNYISSERKKRLKPILNKDGRTQCDKKTSD